MLSFVVGLLVVVAEAEAKPKAGQLPTMGWSGYLAFMQGSGHCDEAGAGGYNETTFINTMTALETTGLKDLGYIYLNAGKHSLKSLLQPHFDVRIALLPRVYMRFPF